MKNIVMLTVLAAALCAAAGRAAEPAPSLTPQRAPDFFPLGVYWPGEYVPRTAQGPDWAKIGPLLDSLAANHCNTVWLTHIGAADAAKFARRAAARGIYLVAALGELAGNEKANRQPAYFKDLPERTLKAWGDAPKPIAWGLGDEPLTEFMQEMKPYSEEWAKSGEPTTTVVITHDIPAAGALLKLQFLCTDAYPFFGAGDPNGPDNSAESAAYLYQVGRRAQHWAKKNGIEWWCMGAIFQEAAGNHEFDGQGNVVYPPGFAPHYRMPTVTETRWQNWAALAAGARGLIHFALFLGDVPVIDPNAKPVSFGYKEKTNSGAPMGMLYRDGRPTPQYLEMGRAFGAIAKLTPILKTIEPVETPAEEQLAFHASGWIPPGDIVQVMRTTNAKAPVKYYVIVANGEVGNPQPRDIPVNIAATVVRVTDLRTGQTLPLRQSQVWRWEPVCPPFQQARVSLPPGDGALLELTLADATITPPPSALGVVFK